MPECEAGRAGGSGQEPVDDGRLPRAELALHEDRPPAPERRLGERRAECAEGSIPAHEGGAGGHRRLHGTRRPDGGDPLEPLAVHGAEVPGAVRVVAEGLPQAADGATHGVLARRVAPQAVQHLALGHHRPPVREEELEQAPRLRGEVDVAPLAEEQPALQIGVELAEGERRGRGRHGRVMLAAVRRGQNLVRTGGAGLPTFPPCDARSVWPSSRARWRPPRCSPPWSPWRRHRCRWHRRRPPLRAWSRSSRAGAPSRTPSGLPTRARQLRELPERRQQHGAHHPAVGERPPLRLGHRPRCGPVRRRRAGGAGGGGPHRPAAHHGRRGDRGLGRPHRDLPLPAADPAPHVPLRGQHGGVRGRHEPGERRPPAPRRQHGQPDDPQPDPGGRPGSPAPLHSSPCRTPAAVAAPATAASSRRARSGAAPSTPRGPWCSKGSPSSATPPRAGQGATGCSPTTSSPVTSRATPSGAPSTPRRR